MKIHLLMPLALFLSVPACLVSKEKADLVVTNGVIYTVNESFDVAEAMAIRNGRILATGSTADMLGRYKAAEIRDLEGAFVYPGWIDAHCHFFGYGMNLNAADLTGTTSVEEILDRLAAHRERYPDSPWITGRGWDQNDWEEKNFPSRADLDALFPDTPVLLRRIDGHAAWVNSRALELAGIHAGLRVEGGSIVLDHGEPTGILIDNAIGLAARMVPGPETGEIVRALKEAEQNCFRVGLTSVQDAGLPKDVVEWIDSLHRTGELTIRIDAWLEPSRDNIDRFVLRGPYRTDRLSVNTIKLFADGALGSRGARMLEDYSDDPGNRGLFVTSPEELERLCRLAFENRFAVATHCIGDEANRLMLGIYGDILGGKNDRRWRIEHAQVVHPGDFDLFGRYSILPSVQPTHATSDMDWAEDRLGPQRIKGAYAYRQLLDQNGWLPAGSDFPVEDINPLFGFYAAVVRKDKEGNPAGGFQTGNALTREEALRAMTIWAARAAFEEDLKGSLEAGKLADFVVTATDLMTAPEKDLHAIPVESTYSGGVEVYRRMP
ncbi:MAG: amidohydrolase [Bacteroidales bacterium]